jgi:uncharacterized DUF497 family protein
LTSAYAACVTGALAPGFVYGSIGSGWATSATTAPLERVWKEKGVRPGCAGSDPFFLIAHLQRIDNSNTSAYLEFMDEHYELKGISFVWDRAKAQRNLSKHGVSFEAAAEVFFDPFLRVTDASADEEARDAIVGMDETWNLLYVVHVVIEQSRVRVVSARKATRRERQWYED